MWPRPYRAIHDEPRDGAGAPASPQLLGPYPTSDAGHDPTIGSCSVSQAAWAGRSAIEPLFVRIAFVVLALFSGVGILIYLACLALLADSPTAPPTSTHPAHPRSCRHRSLGDVAVQRRRRAPGRRLGGRNRSRRHGASRCGAVDHRWTPRRCRRNPTCPPPRTAVRRAIVGIR